MTARRSMPSGLRLYRDRRGVAALEFALVLPVMLILFFGVIDVTQVIRAYTKLGIAAQAINDMVAGEDSASLSSVLNAYVGGQLVMAPFPASSLAVSVVSVTFDGSGNPATVAWQVDEGGAPSIPVSTACSMADGLGLGNDSVIIVRATYSYTAMDSHILPASFTLSHVAYGRPRNISAIPGTSSSGAATGNC